MLSGFSVFRGSDFQLVGFPVGILVSAPGWFFTGLHGDEI